VLQSLTFSRLSCPNDNCFNHAISPPENCRITLGTTITGCPPGGRERSPAPRLPQNVACRFPALLWPFSRSTGRGSEAGDLRTGESIQKADTVALVKKVAGDTEAYDVAIYKAEAVKSFKKRPARETIYFEPYLGERLAWEYILFLRNVQPHQRFGRNGNRCPECSACEPTVPITQRRMDADERKTASEANEARRQAMRELLYRKDS
jgi:hypothetical protein